VKNDIQDVKAANVNWITDPWQGVDNVTEFTLGWATVGRSFTGFWWHIFYIAYTL
jgi:hypothetical protein